MPRYHVIKHPLGGSDVFDENGNQVGYSLPALIGEGEDFYDMDGNPVGMSFDDEFGGYYVGENGSHGPMDREFMMGRHIYMHGDMGERRQRDPWEDPLEDPGVSDGDDFGFGPDSGGGFESFDD